MKNKSIKNKVVSVTTDDLALMVQKGFVAIDKRFDGVDKRFDGVDKRFDKVEERLDRIENILINEHNSRIERLEDKMLQVQVLLKTNFK